MTGINKTNIFTGKDYYDQRGTKELAARNVYSYPKVARKRDNPKGFCKQYDLTLHTLYYWLQKYKQKQGYSQRGFLQVEVESPKDEIRDEIHIQYPYGVMVRLNKTMNISRIRALIKAV